MIPDGYVQVNVPGAGEASWCAHMERYGVKVVYDPPNHDGVPTAHAPEWALHIMRATRPVQGGMRRRAIKLCLREPKVGRAVQAAHRLGGDEGVWSVLCMHLYGLDSGGGTPDLTNDVEGFKREVRTPWSEVRSGRMRGDTPNVQSIPRDALHDGSEPQQYRRGNDAVVADVFGEDFLRKRKGW